MEVQGISGGKTEKSCQKIGVSFFSIMEYNDKNDRIFDFGEGQRKWI